MISSHALGIPKGWLESPGSPGRGRLLIVTILETVSSTQDVLHKIYNSSQLETSKPLASDDKSLY